MIYHIDASFLHIIYITSNSDIKKITDLATKKLSGKITREEAIWSLQQAGILDKKGEFTAPYQELAKAVSPKK